MKNLIFLVICSCYFSVAFADPVSTGPVYIESIAAIELQTAGHAPGNFEVKLREPLPEIAGISCHNTYLTTKKINDPDGRIFMMLILAKTKKMPVELYVSDDNSYTAIYGRCSITAVVLI